MYQMPLAGLSESSGAFAGLGAVSLARGNGSPAAFVHKDILAAVVRLDEAVAFRRVEPLHRSYCHFSISIKNSPTNEIFAVKHVTPL